MEEVLRTAILQMMRKRKNSDFFAVEPLQQLYPEDWEQFLSELEAELQGMEKEGLLELKTVPNFSLSLAHPVLGKKICPKSKL